MRDWVIRLQLLYLIKSKILDLLYLLCFRRDPQTFQMSGASIPLGGEQDKTSMEVEVVQRDSSNLARQKIEKEVDQFLRARASAATARSASLVPSTPCSASTWSESVVFCQ